MHTSSKTFHKIRFLFCLHKIMFKISFKKKNYFFFHAITEAKLKLQKGHKAP